MLPALPRLFGRRARAPRRPRLPRVCEEEISSARIAPHLDGLRLGQLSDVHIRAGAAARRLNLAVDLLNALRPDLVVLTGDYVCVSTRALPSLTAALSRLEVPAYATLGNHDHWSGARKVRGALERAGVDVLVNEHRAIPTARGALHLVGVDDCITGHHDPEKAFGGVPRSATLVVLSHDPRSVRFLWPFAPALVLSGHTHGGQIYVPGLTPFVARRVGSRYLAGLFEVEGAVLFVTRGIGATLPVRLGAPPEVAHLTLRARRVPAT